ncbi:MAG: PucR family transcriptional regulator [Sciscionella sp.]
MITVRGVVDRVGPTLLRAVAVPNEAVKVTDVVIAEPCRKAALAVGDLVLGIAAANAAQAAELVRNAGERGAVAVLLKPPTAEQASVLSAARKADVGVVEVHAQTSWAQLVWLLRTVLDAAADESDALEDGGSADGAALQDLFRLADAVASVVDAPVTIEDTNSRVLAYSARQDITDPARISTIMGRRIPDDVLAKFRSRGVFRALSRGRSTIFVPAQADGTLPRLIVPIRMGGELLGSMWAVVTEPPPEERTTAFADAGPVVALHLLRRRALVDTQRRRSADTVRALLAGRTSPRVAAAELGLGDRPHRVVAIDVAGGSELDTEGVRLALSERLTAGVGRQPAVAELHEVLYAVVPDGTGSGDWQSLRQGLAEQPGVQPLLAAGSAVPLAELATSRAQADEALGLLRAGLLAGTTATHEDAWSALALHRAATAAAAAGVTSLGPLPRLQDQDATTGTDYLATLYHWLRYPVDPRLASAQLSIHPNTLRYRMRRIAEITGADLDDPDVRLALLTQLIALRWA